MSRQPIDPPLPGEYAPFYEGYICLARSRDPLTLLPRQPSLLQAGLAGMTDDEALHRYAPEKWTIKEVIGHITDAERVFSYRLLRIARGDTTPMGGFDENEYVRMADFDSRTLPALLEDFAAARLGTLRILDGVHAGAWTNLGIANDSPISARALLYILPGHVEHHLELLRERYEVALPGAEIGL